MKINFFRADEDGDGINDHVSIRTMDLDEPLIGDSRGVELCRINYIPSRPDSVSRAEQIANIIAAQLHAQMDKKRGGSHV